MAPPNQPPYGHDPYNPPPYGQGPRNPPPPGYGEAPYRNPRDPRRRDGGTAVANVIRLVVGVVVTIFLLHILFVLTGANQANGFVSAIYDIAKVLVLGLGDVFTPDDAKLGVVLNYGFAALIYLAVGQLVIKLISRP